MSDFKFLPQARAVQGLLEVCEQIMMEVPEPGRKELTQAMLRFEEFATKVLWSPSDTELLADFALTASEQREVILRCMSGYEPQGMEIEDIERIARGVIRERGCSKPRP